MPPLPSLLLGLGLVGAQQLGLDVNMADGSFRISQSGKPWLSGGEVQVQGLSAAKGELKVASTATSKGTDPLGAYDVSTLRWADATDASGAVLMETSFRTYPADPSAIVFEQHFPMPLDDYPGRWEVKDNFDTCRVVTNKFQLTKSASGYDAYTKANSSSMEYDPQPGMYCDSGHDWVYTANVDEKTCQAKCLELDCGCFDVSSPSPTSFPARTIFPAFARGGLASDSLDAFAYHGVFPKLRKTTLGTYSESHQGGAPLVIYDSKDPDLANLVFSPLNLPKAHHMASTSEFVGAGVKASATTIPAGHSQLFLLTAAHGVAHGMDGWGERMMKFNGKTKVNNMYKDTTHGTIGFWTDNGGYYHYSTGVDKSRTYEEVLPEVKAYHDSIGVPFGHWQFDSWFYPKDGGVSPGGGGGAVVNWTSMRGPNSGGTVVFPSGMAGIQTLLAANTSGSLTPGKMPTIMHNRQWSNISDYIHNWTDIPWYTSDKAAIPHDPAAFFTRFFTQQEGWGLTMYEQDWMCTEYDDNEALQTNLTLADLWLEGMASGAASAGLSIQYCMPYAYDVLAASAHDAVTNARATGDYFHAPNQWAVGGTALFYWALNILPFKDGFYSSTHLQVGGQTVGPELNPDREILMATLSGAMVGPMDGIHLLNKTRVMASCRVDGVVLKPDRPISTTDWCFAQADPECFVYETFSDGLAAYHFNNRDTYDYLVPGMVSVPDNATSEFAVFNWYTHEVTMLAASQNLKPGYEGHVYGMVVPVRSGTWLLLGEVDKYVPLASIRFGKVVATSASLVVDMVGVKGEEVRVCAAKTGDLTPVCQRVTFAAETTTVTFT